MTNSKTFTAIALGAAVTAALTSGVAVAEVTANAAATNNYIWRGITQTRDQAAIQGGIDWGHDSGLYAGTWLSNVDFSDLTTARDDTGYEMDLYAGFANSIGSFDYDLGVITYQYPVTPEINFTEAYVAGTWKVLTLGVNYTVDTTSSNENAGGVFDKGDTYAYGSLDFGTKAGDFSLFAGSYMFDNSSQSGNPDFDYIHYGAAWSKGDFRFAAEQNDIDANHPISGGDPTADNVRFTVTWSKDFELM